MAYSKIRGALARVKYGRIENRRHAEELAIYRIWLQDNKSELRESTRSQLSSLLERAASCVQEVDHRLGDYVAVLSKGGESARNAKEGLELSRSGKRKILKEALQTIVYSWKGDGRKLSFVSYATNNSSR